VGEIIVVEQVFKLNGHKVRPFMLTAKISPRGCSGKLERAMADFSADESFAKAVGKVQEHYGITVTSYAVRNATLKHGETMLKSDQAQNHGIAQERGVPQLIAEMDGCMLPIVEFNSNSRTKDRRKVRTVSWKETRLSMAHEPGKVMPFYASTGIGGSTVEAGKQLEHCAILAGAGHATKIHGVGDGARWIAEQFEAIFGTQATYLLDFYHVCDYLAAAANTCAKRPESWRTRQKNKLKRGEVKKILATLEPHLEPSTVVNEDAPVRACHRYLSNRLGQLDYKSALENDLPIGSGEIESAHGHVLQARLKLAGAWWKVENANKVIALRLNRANQKWDAYWENRRAS